jgi:hypothetical protein
MPTRREFLSSATLTLLAIPLADCGSHKSKQSASTVTDAGDDGALADAAPEAAPPDAAPEAASDAAGDAEAGACNGASDTSTSVPDPQENDQMHTHTVCVPHADLANPPASGATYTTSTALGHSHTVTAQLSDLQDLASNDAVTLTTSLSHDHEHAFIFNT